MKSLLLSFISLMTLLAFTKGKDATPPFSTPRTTQDSVVVALRYQMQNYPASQYRDVYKNFMQDFFGPGHILNDTAASARYLRSELAGDEPFEGPLYEP
ncbi:MAG: hypothetical protein K2J05_04560, partial [Muribaculaceae bacterium]|nr:hypothetical protein [Muribaculaceae bacterium]